MAGRCPALREFEALQPDDPVGVRRESLDLDAQAREDAAVPEDEAGQVAHQDLRGLVVELLPLRGIGGLPGLEEEGVQRGIAVVAVVLPAVAHVEGVDVAVGIRPTAPEGEVGLEVPPPPRLEHGDVLLRLDGHGDARLREHGLEDEGGLLPVTLWRHDQGEGEVGDARGLQELAGLGHVALPHGKLRVVVGARRAHELIAWDVLVGEDRLHDRLAVDGEIDGLADARVRSQHPALGPVVHVEGDHLVAELGDAHHLELRVRADLGEVAGRDALDHVEIAGAQAGQARGGVGDGQELHPIDVDVALVPVVGKALAHDLALGHALHELVGPRAHRLGPETVAELLGRLGRDHHARAIGEGSEERNERLGEVEADGEVVDDVHALDLADLRLAEGAGRVEMTLDVEAHRLRVERLPVVELHARPQLEDDGALVGSPLVAGGELGNDLEIGGDVEELVAQRGEDEPAGVGAADGRIERVGVIVESDAQDALRRRGVGGEDHGRHEREQAVRPAHEEGSLWRVSVRVPRLSTAIAPSPWARTMSGFTSKSTRRAPRSTASHERRETTSAMASTSSGGRPRAPRKSGAPARASSISRARSDVMGAGASAMSFRISTAMPPSPTSTTGPNCGSRRAPTITSASPRTVSCTMKPSRRPRGVDRARRAAISRAATTTSVGETRPSRTAPRSLLCTMSREMAFSTTGKPSRAASSAAASGVAAVASRATGIP